MEGITKIISKNSQPTHDEEEEEIISSIVPELKSTFRGVDLSMYRGHWYPSSIVHRVISFHETFKADDTDIILSVLPKSGTTWLKALAYTIANRANFPLIESPLLCKNPHDLVPFLDVEICGKDPRVKLEDIPFPRILATHVPYLTLPYSIIKGSNCRVIYMCRNPLDQFTSLYFYLAKCVPNFPISQSSMSDCFDKFCKGESIYAPIWDHFLGYWEASKERPEKVLFLKYEDFKEDTIGNMKVLAKFMGYPFSLEEEKRGVIEEISNICSFKNLKGLEVNKNERTKNGQPNSAYFRKGEVGDWANHLTPPMIERINKIMEEKLVGSGLEFKLY